MRPLIIAALVFWLVSVLSHSSPCYESPRGQEYCETFGDAENGHYNSYFTEE